MARKHLAGVTLAQSVPTICQAILDLANGKGIDGFYGLAMPDKSDGRTDHLLSALVNAVKTYNATVLTKEDTDRQAVLVAKIASMESETRGAYDLACDEAMLTLTKAINSKTADKQAKRAATFAYNVAVTSAEERMTEAVSHIALAEKHELANLIEKKAVSARAAFLSSLDVTVGETINGKVLTKFSEIAEHSYQVNQEHATLHYAPSTKTWYTVDGDKVTPLGELEITSDTAGCHVSWLCNGYVKNGSMPDLAHAMIKVSEVKAAGNLKTVKLDGKGYSSGVGVDGKFVTHNAFPKALRKHIANITGTQAPDAQKVDGE
jgi:hypothetical protein